MQSLPANLPLLPLLSDVKHHDYPITVLVHVQELSIQSHFRLRLEIGGRKGKTVPLANSHSHGP